MNEINDFLQMTARSDCGVTYFQENQLCSYISYAQIHEQAIRLAQSLKHLLNNQRRFIAVLWLETSSIESMVTFTAVIIAGGIPVTMHSFYTGLEVISMMNFLEADVLCYSATKYLSLQKLHKELPNTAYLNVNTGEGESFNCAEYRRDGRRHPIHPDTAAIFLSSGSTGQPKGIQLSARNILSNMRSIQSYIDLKNTDIVLITKSFGYCSTVTGEWFTALSAGANIQLADKFIHPFQMISHIEAFRPTFICTVPSTWVPLIKSSKWNASSLSSLRQLLIVGGSIAPDMLTILSKRIPHLSIVPSYGLTEASPRVTYLPYTQLKNKPSSVGIPVNNVSISIVKDGLEVPVGEEGEVVVKGDNVMLGYYADCERTISAITEKGLHTNDIGYLDEEGYLYITGRKDNALNVGGHTIYPEMIEKRLSVHPEVAEVVVTGREDKVWGNRLVAYIVPLSPSLTEQKLHQFCLVQLNSVSRPSQFVFVKQLPLTKNGKIDRVAVKNILR